MATKTPGRGGGGGKFQAGKRTAHLFPNHNETLKRSEREGGKAVEKVADRVVAESLKNSRTKRCVNLMGLLFFFFKCFYYSTNLSSKRMHVFEVLFLYFRENRSVFSSSPA